MLNNIIFVEPSEIEKRSMQIIEAEMSMEALEKFTKEELKVVKRCIHTAADFDYEKNIIFSNDAMSKALKLFKEKTIVVTDTTMALSGVNKTVLSKLGVEIKNFIADEDVIKEAKLRGLTRSAICMEKARSLKEQNKDTNIIIAVGNAPTALIRIFEMIEDKSFEPDFIIGVPVGFVNVVESKELILETKVPSIVARGRKGGSNICAAIINSIIYQLIDREGF